MATVAIDTLDVRGKRLLVRADLNVPILDGKVSDAFSCAHRAHASTAVIAPNCCPPRSGR